MGLFDKIKRIGTAVFTYDIKKVSKLKSLTKTKTKTSQGIHRKFTKAKIDQMKRLRAKGLTFTEIGKRFQISKSTVRIHCLGVKVKGKGTGRTVYNRVDFMMVKKVIALRKMKLSLKQIGSELGIGQTKVWTICKEAGFKGAIAPRTEYARMKGTSVERDIIRLRKGGMNVLDVAKKLGVGKNTVTKVTAKAGLRTDFTSKKSISQAKINQIRYLRERGYSMTQIQKQVNVGGGTIWKYCHDIKFKVFPKATKATGGWNWDDNSIGAGIFQNLPKATGLGLGQVAQVQKEKIISVTKRINGTTRKLVNKLLAKNKSFDEIKQSLQNIGILVAKDTLISYSQSKIYNRHVAYLQDYKLNRDKTIRERHKKARAEGRELLPDHDRICPFCNQQSTMDKDEYVRKAREFGFSKARKLNPKHHKELKQLLNNKKDESKLVIFDEELKEEAPIITFPEDILNRGLRAMDGITEYPKTQTIPNFSNVTARYMEEKRYNCVFCEYRGNTIELKNHMEGTHKEEMTNFVGTFRPDADKNPPYT